tara:strand:+ start:600 stop:3155 length:2556 start_codon:yes stop_codon:yes gene_type:complete
LKSYNLLKQVGGSSPRGLQRQDPLYPTTVDTLFKSLYWTVNGPSTADFSIVTTGSVIEVPFRVYKNNTYIGLIWTSEDAESHAAIAYETYPDYTNVIWIFDLEVSATCPVIDEETRAIAFDVRTSDGEIIFVPVGFYADTPSSRSARVTLPVGNMWGTRYSDGATVTVPPTKIVSITLGLISDSYDASVEPAYLSAPEDCWYRLTTVSLVGGADFVRANYQAPAHSIGISTAYDNKHVVSPERIITTIKALGYSGRINHYCGMSKYPNKSIVGGGTSVQMIETLGSTICQPCTDWHTSLCELVFAEGWDIIFSVSYEMWTPHANQAYAQRDRDGVLGTTGYTPPSYLLIPTDEVGAMPYLGNVFVDFANIQSTAGLTPVMQVGEPFWWIVTATQKPCFYDNGTLVKFNADTGLFAPTFETINDLAGVDLNDTGPIDIANDTLQQTFIKWLRDELGASTLYIKSRVKTVHPTAKMTVLLFVPTLFNGLTGVAGYTNLPTAEWTSPQWDFFMTEAYDDVINGKLTTADRAITIPTDLLGYPSNKIQYLAGFVPDQELAEAFNWTILDPKYKSELWSKIMGNMERNQVLGVDRQYIWAYTQVSEDNLVISDGNWSTVLDRNLIRPVGVNRPARYIDFDGNADGGGNPQPPTPPESEGEAAVIPPTPPVQTTTYNLHLLGDSFVTFSFAAAIAAEMDGRYTSITKDGVNATSLTQQEVRFDSTSDKWPATLVIMDGGLDEFSQPSMDAIDGIVANLGHDRWVWVQPSPSSYILGTTQRTFWNSEVAAIAAHVGTDHYVECLPWMQGYTDGSPGDEDDVTDGLIPRSLRIDYIHENSAGDAARSEVISNFIKAKGW